jgi:uroporphyrinogen-III synthase
MRRLIVTRPAAEAAAWVQAFQALGWEVRDWPLIEFSAPTDRHSLERGRAAWLDHDAVMFVSPQAVSGFFEQGVSGSGAVPSRRPRCWAPGPGTMRALQAAGVQASDIDAPPPQSPQFDSEALWAVVQDQVRPGHRLLVVRGETASVSVPQGTTGSGRDWLVRQCEAAGGGVDWCVAYRRQPPRWTAQRLAEARRALVDGSVWLFSSSEALDNLASLLPGADVSAAEAVVTHPRIAEAARRMGFGRIHSARPVPADVLRALEFRQ